MREKGNKKYDKGTNQKDYDLINTFIRKFKNLKDHPWKNKNYQIMIQINRKR